MILLCSALASCGGGGKAELATTKLPLQPSGLAVGGDVQSKATEVTQTRITDDQLRTIADACRDAVEITDAGEDECSRSVQDQFKNKQPCDPDHPCMKARWISSTKGAAAPALRRDGTGERDFSGGGFITITSSQWCGSAPRNVCVRIAAEKETVFRDLTGASPPQGGTPGTPEGTPGDTGEPSESPAPTDSETESEVPEPSEPGGGETGPGPPGNPEPGNS
ncbi:hypothetical protein [Actinomadura roseirufa]|uniref:hypothetical protein n=1 Tax=Actinomadura roseirufa TaxID=2094049 RepID=UPI0010410D21|nr:hypothetical protein [Actinomadura roseirufa]